MVRGVIQNGAVQFDGPLPFADGTEVSIIALSSGENEGQPPATIGQRLAALGRRLELVPCDLPEDLAINHDHYLHGTPKRQ